MVLSTVEGRSEMVGSGERKVGSEKTLRFSVSSLWSLWLKTLKKVIGQK